MTYVDRLSRSAMHRVGLLLVFGILAVGLTGCYTQLKVADTSSDRQAERPKPEKTYADEYRRE
ncbi:MAG: hypothetical protein V5A20_07525, partial [Salinibacter sp.]